PHLGGVIPTWASGRYTAKEQKLVRALGEALHHNNITIATSGFFEKNVMIGRRRGDREDRAWFVDPTSPRTRSPTFPSTPRATRMASGPDDAMTLADTRLSPSPIVLSDGPHTNYYSDHHADGSLPVASSSLQERSVTCDPIAVSDSAEPG